MFCSRCGIILQSKSRSRLPHFFEGSGCGFLLSLQCLFQHMHHPIRINRLCYMGVHSALFGPFNILAERICRHCHDRHRQAVWTPGCPDIPAGVVAVFIPSSVVGAIWPPVIP